MSPVSRSRKKKSRTVRQRPRSSPFAAVLAEATALLEEQSPLVVHIWASGLLGAIWSAAWDTDEDSDPDDYLAAGVEELIEYAMSKRTPEALAVVRALSTVGEDWSRSLAAEAAEDLAAAGVTGPSWDATVEFTGAYTMVDPFGDLELVALGFADHLVVIVMVHLDQPRLARIMTTMMPDGGLTVAVKQFGGDDIGEPRPLTAAEARARLEWPVELLLGEGPSIVAPSPDESIDDESSDPGAGWALLRARLDEMPDDLVDEDAVEFDTDEVVREFLAGDLTDRELARGWARLVADWAAVNRRSPYRWGPISLSGFLLDEVAPHVVISDEDRPVFTATVQAWVRFAAREHGLPASWDEEAPRVLADFFEAYEEPGAMAHRAECAEAFDLRSYGVVL